MTASALQLLVVVVLLGYATATVFNVWKKDGNYSVSTKAADADTLATADYNRTYETVGWDVLVIEAKMETEEKQGDGYYAAGFLEGYISVDRIHASWVNNIKRFNDSMQAPVRKWIQDHMKYMNTLKVDISEGASTSFVRQVANQMGQLRGIGDGYRAAAPAVNPPLPLLSDEDIFMLNFYYEISDVEMAVLPVPNVTFGQLAHEMHCSAIVKLTEDDLFVSHVTWTVFRTLLREFKTYKFQTTVTMSGYPGQIHSGDDFYITSHQLAIWETTNPQENYTLAKEYVKPTTVSEFMRVMVASYLADDGVDWVHLFVTLNSGSYNNQYVVVDMKRFDPKKPIQSGLMYLVEQMPGPYSAITDHSGAIANASFHPSYNIPFFPEIRKVSGVDEKEKEEGVYWSYFNESRAKMFRRDHHKIKDLATLKSFMRYNNYTSDPLSLIPDCVGANNDKCNPAFSPTLAISSRRDLAIPGGKAEYGRLFGYFVPKCSGSTDVKITSWRRMNEKSATAVVISGPTNEEVPSFDFEHSDACSSVWKESTGLAKVYNFPWTEIVTTYASTIPKAENEKGNGPLLIVLGCVGVTVIGVAIFVLLRKRCLPDGEEGYKPV